MNKFEEFAVTLYYKLEDMPTILKLCFIVFNLVIFFTAPITVYIPYFAFLVMIMMMAKSFGRKPKL